MALAEAIERALNEEAEFPLGFFMVYEGFDEDGQRTLHYVYNDDIVYWQALGWLYAAITALDALLGGASPEDVDD
jgi:hypothetical protein